MRIVTIGREFGSGGREIGKRLAEAFGTAYYDKEIVAEIARQSEVNEHYIEGIFDRGFGAAVISTAGHTLSPTQLLPAPTMRVLEAQRRVIEKLAERDCVIVGRGADMILKDRKPFRIFVYADEASKLKRCRERAPEDECLTEKQLLKKIRKINKGRKKFYGMYYGAEWGHREEYDLCVNTSGADLEKLAPCIAEYIERWFEGK